MLHDLQTRVQKIGQPPGTMLYTGRHSGKTLLTKIVYSEHDFHCVQGKTLEDIALSKEQPGMTWIQVIGLKNIKLIEQLTKIYNIHALTGEDILNVHQRPKVEEFKEYVFITLPLFVKNKKNHDLNTDQISFVLGKNFLISFQEHDSNIFQAVIQRLQGTSNQRLRQQGCDYLAYRLMDTVVDDYFLVLEEVGEKIAQIEENIVTNPEPQCSHELHRIKQQLMSLRKSIWPTREAISHLLQIENTWVTSFTRVYLRDLYDHVVQTLDMIETFRDIVGGMVDIYLSSLANRLNEVMKTLTIIATIFIPITFVTGLFGMNFAFMPILNWRWGFYATLGVMGCSVLLMLNYFRRKKWL
tara:strand:+ start:133778 stop:134842 length:1065 start_codon:yes stop_codon:yes gene_type:complete